MAQLRSVNTKFWKDSWIETLSTGDKLLFLYLITNSEANLAGIYEITIKRICFETGLDNKTVSNGLERFAKVRKAYFVNDNYIFLPNWLKNQNLNTNMKKGVVKIITELPTDVKINILGNGYKSIQNDYQKVLNTLLKYEVEVLEEEVEVEVEEKKESIFTFDQFWKLYPVKTGKKPCKDKYAKISESDRQKIKDTLPAFIAYKRFDDYQHPNPSTYLNQQRWNDELKTVANKQTSIPVSDYSNITEDDKKF